MSVMLKMIKFQEFEAMSKPPLQKVKDTMMNKINLQADQEQLKNLSTKLNQIVLDQSFKDNKIYDKIFNRIPQIVEGGFNNVKIGAKGGVYTDESLRKWQEYKALSTEYNNLKNQKIENLTLAQQRDDALHEALSLQGSLNSLQGQAFESLLQTLLPLVSANVEELSEEVVNSLLETIESKSVIKTKGSDTNTITIDIDGEKVKITSQGKIDVEASSPFIADSDFLKVSAKNYSKLRDINLLSKGSVVGLISQWPTTNEVKNYYYNALGVWHPDTFLQEARFIFGIQSLAGRGGDESELANILILNIRSRNNPISVVSIKSLLQDIDSNPRANDEAFKMIFNTLPVFNQGEERSSDEFRKKVTAVTLDTSLNKAYLTLNYLKHLK